MDILNIYVYMSLILFFFGLQLSSSSYAQCSIVCKRDEVRVLNENGSCPVACKCKPGYFLSKPVDLDTCGPCKKCLPPHEIVANCTTNEDTQCGPCRKDHFYSFMLGSCMLCTRCVDGVLAECTPLNDTKCTAKRVPNCTLPSPRAMYEEESNTCQNDLFRVVIPIIAIVELIIIFFFSIVCCLFVWPMYRRRYRLYRPADASSLATNSSSVLEPRSLSQLTKAERETLIRVLPSTYLEELAKLLNPTTSMNNWVTLAGVLRFTRSAIENFRSNREKYPTFTQDLLHEWGSRNGSTVEALGRALLSIQRDDAVSVLVNYLVSLRADNNDNTSVMSSIMEDGVSEISNV